MWAALVLPTWNLFQSPHKPSWPDPPSKVSILLQGRDKSQLIPEFCVPTLTTIQEFMIMVGLYFHRTIAVKVHYRMNGKKICLETLPPKQFLSELLPVADGIFVVKLFRDKAGAVAKLGWQRAEKLSEFESLTFRQQLIFLVQSMSQEGLPSRGIYQLIMAIDEGYFPLSFNP